MKNIFCSENIEYFSVMPISWGNIINQRLMPENVSSVIVFLIPYRTDREKSVQLAHFAKVPDYHGFAKELFDRIIPKFKKLFPQNSFYGFADHSPLNERHLAELGRLGEVGKNGLIINEKYGSYVFIGEILTDLVLPTFVHEKKRLCTGCGKCIRFCPKKDVCVSQISQKKRKTKEELLLLQETDTVWGCDVCQEVCPLNETAVLSPFPYFYKGRISDPADILKMDEDTFGKYSFSYRGRRVILENMENIFKKHID